MSKPKTKPSKMQGSAGKLPPNAGKGRKKGVPNKVTAALKDMILGALADAGEELEPGGGGQAYLKAQALNNPKAFLPLVGKVLPHDVRLSNPEGDDLSISVSFVHPEKPKRR